MSEKALLPERPEPSEYAAYYTGYVALASGSLFDQMEHQLEEVQALCSTITEEQGAFRYAEGKWTLKELLGHVMDTERIFTYRVLRIARGDGTPIEGFDQEPYVLASNAGRRTLSALSEEYESVRRASITLFRSFDRAAWERRGIANGNPISARAMAYITAGHEAHHLKVLREKYLQK